MPSTQSDLKFSAVNSAQSKKRSLEEFEFEQVGSGQFKTDAEGGQKRIPLYSETLNDDALPSIQEQQLPDLNGILEEKEKAPSVSISGGYFTALAKLES